MASTDNALTGSLVAPSKETVVAVTTPRGGVDVDVDPTIIVRDIIKMLLTLVPCGLRGEANTRAAIDLI